MRHWLIVAISLYCVRQCRAAAYPFLRDGLVPDVNRKLSPALCDGTLDNFCAGSIGPFSSITAIGNMTNYNRSSIIIGDSMRLTLKDMVLPPILTTMTFRNIAALDLMSAKASAWSHVTKIEFVKSKNPITSKSIEWPAYLTKLNLQETGFSDVNYLPTTLTYTLLYNNSIEAVTNQDWRALTFLNLGANPLKSIAFVQLSSTLVFFYCMLTPQLNNITIDNATATALNGLSRWGGRDDFLFGFAIDADIETDPVACETIGGVIQQLFRGKTPYTVTACVLGMLTTESTTLAPSSTTTAPTTSPQVIDISPQASSSLSTGAIVGIVVGILVVFSIVIGICICLRRRQNHGQHVDTEIPYRTINERDLDSKHFTAYTGRQRTAPTQESYNKRGRNYVQATKENATFNLTQLRLHRLELKDLIVTSNKPLAAGAYGEVWLGTYGSRQVAIKRLKSRSARQVQDFIDEIILMSNLDSDYIVQFIGANWTRPIDIECVVEYMNMGDLRSYLMLQSPSQFTWDKKYQSIVSIVHGLIYLHTYRPPIIHRDLKSRNILLDSVKGTKLSDFGTSRVAEVDDPLTNEIGTYQWMAPEVIAGTSYSSQADIYSFGIVLSEFCTHQVPYSNLRQPQTGKLLAQHFLLTQVREGRIRPSFEGENVPTWVKDLAMQCLQLNEWDRPTALELSAILSRIQY